MRFIISLSFLLGLNSLAQAQLSIQMKTAGSFPNSTLYSLSGADKNLSSREIAQFLSLDLQKKTASSSPVILEPTDLASSLKLLGLKNETGSGLDIRQLNKIEYFSKKNQSDTIQLQFDHHQYQIYISSSKNLILVVGS